MENVESIQSKPMSSNLRAWVRDTYVDTFHRSYPIERMAYEDFDLTYKSVGRIEIVEEVTLGVREKPARFVFNEQELQYAEWLRSIIFGVKGNLLLRDQFLHGMPAEMEFVLQGETS